VQRKNQSFLLARARHIAYFCLHVLALIYSHVAALIRLHFVAHISGAEIGIVYKLRLTNEINKIPIQINELCSGKSRLYKVGIIFSFQYSCR